MNNNLFVVYVEIISVLAAITIFSFSKHSKSNYFYVWIIFLTLPIVYFYYIIFSSTNNIPFQDDYSLLESIYNMKHSESFTEWSKAFFSQINQHRFGFERSIMWLIYKTFGNENIKAQIIIGNSFLIGILYLLSKIFKTINLSIAYFTPIPLILFNLTYYENAIWGIAAIQNTPIIFFALLTIHFLSQPNKNNFYWAVMFGTITLFTSGNGIAIWLVGILILSFQKLWKKLGLWILVMISLFIFYFTYDYEMIASDRTNLFKYPIQNILYVFAFWGNVFFQNIAHPNLGPRYLDIMLCIFTGILLLGIIIGFCWKIIKIKFENLSYNTLMLFGGMIFMALTGLMLVFSRPVEIKIAFGGEILSRRYMLFGAVFISLGYLGYLYLTKQNKIYQKFGFICLLPVGLLLNINSYYTSLFDVDKQQQELKLDGLYWKNHQMLLSFGEKYGDKIGYNHPTYMINLINKLDSSGIYELSQVESLPIMKVMRSVNTLNSRVFEGETSIKLSTGNTISRESKTRFSLIGLKKNDKQSIKYFALKSSKNVFLLPAVLKRNSVKDCFITQTLNGSTISYETWKDKFPSDIYEIWVIEQDAEGNFIPLFCKKRLSN